MKKVLVAAVLSSLISIGSFWLFFVDALVDESVRKTIDAQSELVATLKTLSIELEKKNEQLTELLNSTQEDVHFISDIANNEFHDLTGVTIQSGKIAIDANAVTGLNSAEHCKKRGVLQYQVNFEHPYHKPPKVLPSFTTVDFGHGQDHRLAVKLVSVSKQGFVVDFYTWCDTRMSRAELSWLAVGI